MIGTLPGTLQGELRDRLQKTFGNRLDRVVLYGSFARGEATSESDMDVLVVLKESVDKKAARAPFA